MKAEHDLRRLLKDHQIDYQRNTDFDGYMIKSPNGVHINVYRYRSVFEKQGL